MDCSALSAANRRLVETARDEIEASYDPDRHRSAAALRADSGTVYTGLHLDATIASESVHAEAVALGTALSAGETGFEAVATVAHPTPGTDQTFVVASPCGGCRELLYDYAPEMAAAVQTPSGVRTRPIRALLPDAPFRPAPGKN